MDAKESASKLEGVSLSSAVDGLESAAAEGQGDLDVNLFDTKPPPSEVPKEGVKNPTDLVNQLEVFRKQWHSELQNPLEPNQSLPTANRTGHDTDDVEEKAKMLYLKGVELEENHMLMEAIYYYKKAMHLVPDIEIRLAPLFTYSPRERARQDSESSLDESDIDENLVSHFENLCVEDKTLCSPAYEQRATHISALPVELVMYILQWVVSPSLDLRFLESVSQVCRGLFLCARDEQIWKMACDRMWGINVGKAKKYGGSWRQMIIERPHPLFDGCYISRISYVRQGEQSMDNFYRPCHMVQYYRFLRFFPDGTVMMLVSPEEPTQSLAKLRHSNSRASGLLIGGYKLLDSRISCVMTRVKTEQHTVYRYKRQRRQAAQNETKTSYYLDLDISAAQKRPNAKLTWMKYSSSTYHKSTGEESVSDFDLTKSSFPSLVFSHVTSYTSPSTQPLT